MRNSFGLARENNKDGFSKKQAAKVSNCMKIETNKWAELFSKAYLELKTMKD